MENVHIFKKHGKWILSEGGAVVHASEDFSEIGCSAIRVEAEITSCLPDILKSLVFCIIKI